MIRSIYTKHQAGFINEIVGYCLSYEARQPLISTLDEMITGVTAINNRRKSY